MAQEDANQDLQFEINSRLSEIANSLLDSVLNNFNTFLDISFKKFHDRKMVISFQKINKLSHLETYSKQYKTF